MNQTVDQKWDQVRIFYSRAYKMKFKERPVDFVVHSLFEQMVKINKYFRDFYFHQDHLWVKLQQIRGKIGSDDPVKKKKSWE